LKRLVKVSLRTLKYSTSNYHRIINNPGRDNLCFAHLHFLRSAMMKRKILKLWSKCTSRVALSGMEP
jgi:hypothetical protein